MANFLSTNHPLDLYLPKYLGPCDFLPFFLINVFQKKSLLSTEGLRKSCIRTTLSLLIRVWWRSIHTISWVWVSTMGVVNTMSPYIYHNPMWSPWVAIYTMSPCLYHESMSIPWVHVHVYTMSPCQFHASISIPWVPANNMSQCL